MSHSKKRSASDPQHLGNFHQPGDHVSAASTRHHRRSVDRVWPPALEVQLARMSMDEGHDQSNNSSSPTGQVHIIPAPPPLPEIEEELGDPGCRRSEDTLASVDGLKEEGALYHDGRRDPTSALYLDDQHQRHYQEHPLPHIDVQFRKHHHPHHPLSLPHLHPHLEGGGADAPPQRQQLTQGYEHAKEQASSKDGSGDHATILPRSLPIRPDLLNKQLVYSDSPMLMDTTEFGSELFVDPNLESAVSHHHHHHHQHHPHHHDSTGAHSDLPPRPTPLRQQEVYGSGHIPSAHASPLLGSQAAVQQPTPASSSLLHSKIPLTKLPGASSRSNSKPSSRPSSKPSSRSTSPATTPRLPLRELVQNTLRSGHSSPKKLAMPSIHHLLPHQNDENQLGIHTAPPPPAPAPRSATPSSVTSSSSERGGRSSPFLLPLPSMRDEQDRWKSPTLSALASPIASSSPSPRLYSTTLQPSSSSPSASFFPNRNTKWRHLTEDHQDQMDIPLIEAHDEISLQEIWRMEDQERMDRVRGDLEDGQTLEPQESQQGHGHGHWSMKGEQHAHEEAALVQEVLRSHH